VYKGVVETIATKLSQKLSQKHTIPETKSEAHNSLECHVSHSIGKVFFFSGIKGIAKLLITNLP